MDDHEKTKSQLIEELADMRAELESVKRDRLQTREDLERRVTRRTAELAEANEWLTREARERKHAEATLRESEERYRSLVETTTDLIFEIDRDGVYTYVNSKAKDLLGYEPEELIGKTIFEFLPRDEGKRIAELLREKAAEGKSISKVDVVRFHKTGRAIISETSAVPIFDSNGKCRGFRGISRDVTQRKKVEKALHKERQHLRRSLEASDQERKLIAYEIHDGLTQHLAAAVMQFQTFDRLQSRKPLEAAKVFDTGMQILGHSLSEARRLISGVRPPLLDEAGVLAAVESLIYETTSRGAEVQIEFHHKVEFTRLAPALENALYRIIQESLANVCQHSKSEKARIEIRQTGDDVRVEVRDWGIGFASQRVDEGCYGLAGIRERARVLGGRAAIDSTRGEGTLITVELPLMKHRLDSPSDKSLAERTERP